ncbi:hypothetical protein [Halobellus inordinatus]|uniref:hypothetical protein n=1 Tax=Halobellus inordinatus TaxID=1126236 RepID=UPI002108920D|nr:hypothetical protein [Halobellus inordinatus]
MTEISPPFPYVGERLGNESKNHVKLKGLVVYWLLSQGFKIDDIEDEHHVSSDRASGNTDIYASTDGIEVFVECETNSGGTSLSNGGKIPFKKGKDVYVFTSDGIYRPVKRTYELEKQNRVLEQTDEETITRTRIELQRESDLPKPDLSAFKR